MATLTIQLTKVTYNNSSTPHTLVVNAGTRSFNLLWDDRKSEWYDLTTGAILTYITDKHGWYLIASIL